MTSDRLKRLIPFRHSASRDGEDRLCVACQRVVTKLAVHDEPLNYKHRATSRELVEDRALQGCPLCLRFLALLSPEDRKAMRDHKDRSSGSPINLWNDRYEVKYYMYGRPPVILYPIGQILPEVDRYVTITLEYHAPKQSWNTRSWKLEAILNDASSLDDTIPFVHPDPQLQLCTSTNSRATWDCAKKWLHDCQAQHDECQLSSSFLPTRLIGIGRDPEQQFVPHLVCGSEILPGSQYATLSHCWGGYVPVKLLLANIAEMRSKITIEDLPKTFQDAILACQKLNIEFLWIDSLCIIQDSIADWNIESALMCRIYEGGVCNLAAAAARDGRGGLFFQREPRIVRPLEIRTGEGKRSSRGLIFDHRMWDQGVECMPLYSRGWVCQERLLSPRTLHFGHKQVFFECKSTAFSEAFPDKMPEVMRAVNLKRNFQATLEPKTHSSPESSKWRLWWAIVEFYTKCSISFETDRLVAIAGIAQKFHEKFQSGYYAGMWGIDLPLQLVWEAADGLLQKTVKYVAPSWSWCSNNGAIHHKTWTKTSAQESGPNYLIEILDVSVDLVTENPFGQVSGGYLLLGGQLAEMRIVDNPELQMRNSEFMCLSRNERWYDETLGLYSITIVPDFYFKTSDDRESLYLLPVLGYHGHDRGFEGVILQKASEAGPGTFRRWGYFSKYEWRVGEVYQLEPLCQAFHKNLRLRAELGLKECDDDASKYVIRII